MTDGESRRKLRNNWSVTKSAQDSSGCIQFLMSPSSQVLYFVLLFYYGRSCRLYKGLRPLFLFKLFLFMQSPLYPRDWRRITRTIVSCRCPSQSLEWPGGYKTFTKHGHPESSDRSPEDPLENICLHLLTTTDSDPVYSCVQLHAPQKAFFTWNNWVVSTPLVFGLLKRIVVTLSFSLILSYSLLFSLILKVHQFSCKTRYTHDSTMFNCCESEIRFDPLEFFTPEMFLPRLTWERNCHSFSYESWKDSERLGRTWKELGKTLLLSLLHTERGTLGGAFLRAYNSLLPLSQSPSFMLL